MRNCIDRNNLIENGVKMIYTKIEYQGSPVTFSGMTQENSEKIQSENFSEFVKEFPEHKIVDDKAHADFFIGVEFNADGIKNERKQVKRCADNVMGVYFIILDYDDGTVLDQLRSQLSEHNYLLYTTFSHKPEHHKFRVILPLSSKASLSDINARKVSLLEMFKGVDKASFSSSQGFYMPSIPHAGAERVMCHNLGNDFDLLSLSTMAQDDVHNDISNRLLSGDEHDHYSQKREKVVADAQPKMTDGNRNNELKTLAIILWRLHASRLEIETRLAQVISQFPAHKRDKHKNKAKGLADWVSKSGIQQDCQDSPKFNPKFTLKEDASGVIADALNKPDDTLLLVTAGVGKTEETIKYSIQQANLFKPVAIYVNNHDLQREIEERLIQARINAKKINAKKRTWLDQAIVITGREKGLCDNFDHIKMLQKREAHGERGLVKQYCQEDCYYSDGACRYADQFTDVGLIKVYTHAHLFSAKSIFDRLNHKLVIVDEDILNTALNVSSYTHEDGKKMALDYQQAATKYNIETSGYCGELLTILANDEINTPDELLGWVNKHEELVMGAFNEHQRFVNTHRQKVVQGKAFIFHRLFYSLASVFDKQVGSQSIYVRQGQITHTYLKEPRIPENARLIHLDATGDSKVVNAIYRRNLAKVEVNVDKQHSKIIQVRNASASQNRVDNNVLWDRGRMSYLKDRVADGAVIMSKKADKARELDISHSDGQGLYYGKQRGSNLFQNCREMHVAMAYNLPSKAIEDAARAIYYYDQKPLTVERRKEFVMVRGVEEKVINFNYRDHRMVRLDDHLSRSELEQAVHRARLVQRTAENPVVVYIHTNRALNITVDELVRWQVLYGVVDGNEQRSVGSIDSVKQTITANMDGVLRWKRKDVMSLGVSDDQWKRVKDFNTMAATGLTGVDVVYKTPGSKTKCAKLLLDFAKISGGSYNNNYIGPTTKNGALAPTLAAALKAKSITSTTVLFGDSGDQTTQLKAA